MGVPFVEADHYSRSDAESFELGTNVAQRRHIDQGDPKILNVNQRAPVDSNH